MPWTTSTSNVHVYRWPPVHFLGPILFLLYTADLLQLVRIRHLTQHAYADDLQIYSECSPADVVWLQDSVSACVDDVACWMTANCRLQLNHAKSEVLWCSSTRRQHQITDRTVQPASTVRDDGIMVDGEVTMSAHVSAVVKASFAALRRIRSVRRSTPRRALLTLIRALVVSKVDYCNSLLAGVSDTLLRQLQSVLNAAAWLVFSARKSERITPLLRELHWLRVPKQIKFRLCVLTFRRLHGTAPRYLAETLHLTTSRSSCSRLRSAATSTLIITATRRRTLGDRAFPVAAVRVWNSLPSFVRDESHWRPFHSNRRQYLSGHPMEDANIWAASLLTRDCNLLGGPATFSNVVMPP